MAKSSQITMRQLRLLHVSLRNNGLDEEKANLVHFFTEGRTSHCKEMRQNEFSALVKALQKDDPKRKMIRKIFALGYDLGWLMKGGKDDAKMNAAKVDGFLQSKHSVVRKPLGKCNVQELAKIVSQWERIRNKQMHFDIKSICKEVGVVFEPK